MHTSGSSAHRQPRRPRSAVLDAQKQQPGTLASLLRMQNGELHSHLLDLEAAWRGQDPALDEAFSVKSSMAGNLKEEEVNWPPISAFSSSAHERTVARLCWGTAHGAPVLPRKAVIAGCDTRIDSVGGVGIKCRRRRRRRKPTVSVSLSSQAEQSPSLLVPVLFHDKAHKRERKQQRQQ